MQKRIIPFIFLLFFLFLNLLINPAFATEIFNDGFESGDFSAWTGTTVTADEADLSVQSTEKYQGGYGADAYIHYTSSWWLNAYCYKNLGSTHSKLYARAYFKFTGTFPAQEITSILELRLSGTSPYTVICIGVNDGGNGWFIQYTDGDSKQTETVSDTVQTGVWYCLEIMEIRQMANWKFGKTVQAYGAKQA